MNWRKKGIWVAGKDIDYALKSGTNKERGWL